MKTTLFYLVFFCLYAESFSQNLYFYGEFLPDNCYCKSYTIQGRDSIIYDYTPDSLGRTIARRCDTFGSNDSAYYDANGKILQTSQFFYRSNGSISFIRKVVYTYSQTGKILSRKTFLNNALAQSTEYTWDQKDRPATFRRNSYDIENVRLKSDSVSIKYHFINDTIATLQFSYNGNVIATGKQIYNKKHKIVNETLENPSKGKKVQFEWKYYANGSLKSIHKVKVIGGDINFENSDHYTVLNDANRKIAFEYDSKGRIIAKKIYQSVNLDKVLIYRYTYQ